MRKLSLAGQKGRCFLILCFCVIASCISTPISELSKTSSSIVKEYKHITLYGNQPGMVNTGIYLNERETYSILATGSIDLWPGGPKYRDVRPEHGWPVMMRVGTMRYIYPFKYNNAITTTTGPQYSGELYLGIRDGNVDEYGESLEPYRYDGNTGSFSVDIIVWKENDNARISDYLEMMREKDPNNKAIIEALHQVHAQQIQTTVKEFAHYRVYEEISFKDKNLEEWVETDILIPRGAMVAVMAKGRVWVGDRAWQPWYVLSYKVGKDGLKNRLMGGLSFKKDPRNSHVMKSRNAGPLYFHINIYSALAKQIINNMTATVIVWDIEHQHEIEADVKELIHAHPDNQQYRHLVIDLATCFYLIGDYGRAGVLLKWLREKSQELYLKSADIYLLSAQNEYRLGRCEKSKAYAEKTLGICRRAGDQYMVGTALSRLALAYSCLGEYQKAIQVSEQALGIDKGKGGEYRFISSLSHFFLQYNYLRMNNPSMALKHGKEALKILSRADYPYGVVAESFAYLGESQVRLGQQEEAKKSFESAITKATMWGRPEAKWWAYSRLGKILENEGDNQKAFEHYAEAIKIIEAMRGKLADPGLKALFVEKKLYVYEWMIRLLKKMKRDADAFHYLERARARAMLDMLGEKVLFSKDKEKKELLSREVALRKQVEQRFMGLRGVFPGQQAEPDERVGELKRLQSAHRAILKKIEGLNPELASLVTINPLKAGEIQDLLDSGTVLLEYFLGKETQLVFIVTPEKVVAVPLKMSTEELFEMIRGFRANAVEGISLEMLAKKDYRKHLSELYDILIKPVEDEISGKKHLVIVPHGMLHYLPFQAVCFKSGKYLIEDYAISYLPSASVLKYARVKNKGNRENIFAAGNPMTGLAALPAAEEEAREVSALFENKLVLTGREATETEVKGQAPRYDMVLLSTHGEMIENDPLKSNLRFASSTGDDGKLTVDEIFDMEIRANLVTLSACETALVKGEAGDFPEGDDLVGLSRAFIHAGAPSVVASLWKVSDDSTVELMRSFYRNLETMSKAGALQKAQLDLMHSNLKYNLQRGSGGITRSPGYQPGLTIDCSHPFFWAPFILVGDWR